MDKITTNLWFDNQAEEAAAFYASIFTNSKIGTISRYGKEGFEIHGKPEGTAMVVPFELEGRSFTALNGGSQFKFNESISFVIHCEDQQEIDYYWEKLSAGGEEQPCGWLKDQFGLSWQIVPKALGRLMSHPDPEKSQKVAQALFSMKKIILADLEKAAGN